MDLFKLLGTIEIDNKNANKSLDETSQKGEQAKGRLSKAFTSIGSAAVKFGKTVAVGMVAAGTAVAGLVTKSVQSYAEYEQLVGGVETLFKTSADKVQEYANNAYKTAGLSANEYMETVTSFSASLLQSLDNDTAAAAEKANKAITDMADNANKMGTDMSSIQNAYQGFAKSNYTMLDNLKLGYGGTKEEMARLLEDAEAISGIEYDISSYADIVDAIHVIQTEMDITGTTAKEASTTIQGSFSSMKGAWQNLLTAMSAKELPVGQYVKAFVDSVSTVADNLLPRIRIALDGVVQLVNQLAPQIVSAIPMLVSALLPAVVGAATSLIAAAGAKLNIAWQNRAVRLCAVPVTDYTAFPVDGDVARLSVRQFGQKVNHLVCLGKGELAEREVIHLYADSFGRIGDTKYYSGLDEVAAVYDNTSTEELRSDGIKKLEELRNSDTAQISIPAASSLTYDIGDIVGASDIYSGVSVAAAVEQKIVKINNGVIKIEYKAGG